MLEQGVELMFYRFHFVHLMDMAMEGDGKILKQLL